MLLCILLDSERVYPVQTPSRLGKERIHHSLSPFVSQFPASLALDSRRFDTLSLAVMLNEAKISRPRPRPIS